MTGGRLAASRTGYRPAQIRPSKAGRFRTLCVTQKGRILNHAFSDGSQDSKFWINLLKNNRTEVMVKHCSQKRNQFIDHGRGACSLSLWTEPASQPDESAAPW